VLITGVSPKSIGAALALALATQSPHLLILASRTPSKIQAIARSIHASHPDVTVREVTVDLSSQTSVRTAAAQIHSIIKELSPKTGLDILFNNAGINVSEKRLSKEGIELQFATNHLGPFLLTNLLLPLFFQPEHSPVRKRIVNTSSDAHRISPVRFSDINQEPGVKVEEEDKPRRGLPKGMLREDGRYEPAVAYGASKTANVLMCVQLNKILGKRLRSFALMPGSELSSFATLSEVVMSCLGINAISFSIFWPVPDIR
jgi:NAD(P)-dependent dehydrogenase (short-subunit alcohol dehydrogenase family)